MNAPAIIADVEPTATLEEFEEMCCDYAGFWQGGILGKIDAVDCVQRNAELWGMVETLGQDEVQRLMAIAFAPAPELPSDYASRLVRDWELGDERDRWRHTGELPPQRQPMPQWPSPRAYETPEFTIAAFSFVLSLNDADYLDRWLADHPRDVDHLHKLWKAKHVGA